MRKKLLEYFRKGCRDSFHPRRKKRGLVTPNPPPPQPQCTFLAKHFRLIRHLTISHNASYLPPTFCITFVFHFSWVLQPSQEKLKTMLMQNVGGANKVHYRRSASGEVFWVPPGIYKLIVATITGLLCITLLFSK